MTGIYYSYYYEDLFMSQQYKIKTTQKGGSYTPVYGAPFPLRFPIDFSQQLNVGYAVKTNPEQIYQIHSLQRGKRLITARRSNQFPLQFPIRFSGIILNEDILITSNNKKDLNIIKGDEF